jgi:hypothetical protein
MLINAKGQVTPECAKSHITYSFDLRHPVDKINIHFVYYPKRLEDLEQSKKIIYESIEKYTLSEHVEALKEKWQNYMPLTNAITLSIDDPERHRGAVHRHEPEQLLQLSEHQASPGLVSGLLIEGMWKVTLSLHSIISEVCSYELQIWAEGDPE